MQAVDLQHHSSFHKQGKPVASSSPMFTMRRVLIATGSVALTGLMLTTSYSFGYTPGFALASSMASLSLAKYAIRAIRPPNLLGKESFASSAATSFQATYFADDYEVLPPPPRAALQEDWDMDNEIGEEEPPVDSTFMLKTSSDSEAKCLEQDALDNRLLLSPCNGVNKQQWRIENQQLRTLDGHCVRSLTSPEMKRDRNNPYRCNVTLISCEESNSHISYTNNRFYSGRFVFRFRDDQTACFFDMAHINEVYRSEDAIRTFSHQSEFVIYDASSPELIYCRHNKRRQLFYPMPVSYIHHIRLEANRKNCSQFINPLIPVNVPKTNAYDFPMAVNKDAPRIYRVFKLQQAFIPRTHKFGFNNGPANQKMTGLYAAPGDVITVHVAFKKPNRQCTLHDNDLLLGINLHTDQLKVDSPNVARIGQFLRPPSIAYEKVLRLGISQHRTAYGGSLSLVSFANKGNCTLLVTLEGAVAAPHFNIKEHSPNDWSEQRNNPAPWAVLEGRRITTILPSQEARALIHPRNYITLADRMAEENLCLWGFEPEAKVTDPLLYPGEGNEIFIHDVQITSGIAHVSTHSRYIMINSAYSPTLLMEGIGSGKLNPEELSTSELGKLDTLPHELGHLLHPLHLFNGLGTQAVAAISGEYVLERLFKRSVLAEQCAYHDAIRRLRNGNSFYEFVSNNEHKDYTAQAVFIRQIIDAFPAKGWNIFKSVTKHYRTNGDMKNEHLKKYSTEQERLDYFFELISNASSHNLLNHFERWGFAISEDAVARVAHLPLPDKVISELTGLSNATKCQSTDQILDKYFAFIRPLLPELSDLAQITLIGGAAALITSISLMVFTLRRNRKSPPKALLKIL